MRIEKVGERRSLVFKFYCHVSPFQTALPLWTVSMKSSVIPDFPLHLSLYRPRINVVYMLLKYDRINQDFKPLPYIVDVFQ